MNPNARTSSIYDIFPEETYELSMNNNSFTDTNFFRNFTNVIQI